MLQTIITRIMMTPDEHTSTLVKSQKEKVRNFNPNGTEDDGCDEDEYLEMSPYPVGYNPLFVAKHRYGGVGN